MSHEKPYLELDYVTPKVPIDIMGFQESINCYDLGIDFYELPLATIEWHFDPDARGFGIKSMGIIVDKIVCCVEWELTCPDELTPPDIDKLIAAGGIEQRNGNFEGTVEINSDTEWKGKKWEIDSSEFFMKQDGQCYPTDCEIDFKTMTIKIS